MFGFRQLNQVYGVYAAGVLPKATVPASCSTQYNLSSVNQTRDIGMLWKDNKVHFGVSKPVWQEELQV